MPGKSSAVRCAVYTRKSTDEGLDQEFNSLEAQFEACSAYIASQKHEGWRALLARYDDGGFSGGTLERPGLQRLFSEIDAGRIDMVVVYKIDRLTRSLPDFGKLVERLERANCSFVSVTQSFNTSSSMGRLTLNVLLSFAQFEREVTAERIRDKIAASKKKGIWMGGSPPLGYTAKERQLVLNEPEARRVRKVFELFLHHRCLMTTKRIANELGIRSRPTPKCPDGPVLTRGGILWILTNPAYTGRIRHRAATYAGQHQAIVDDETWGNAQKLLALYRSSHRRGIPNTRERSLLVGKIFTESGQRLTPRHSSSAGKRSRYYVSEPPTIAQVDAEKSGAWRISGEKVEVLVASMVARRLANASRDRGSLLSDPVANASDEVSHRPAAVIPTLGDKPLLALVEKVRLFQGVIRVDLSRQGLADLVGLKNEDVPDSMLHISAQFQMRRTGVETRLLVGDDTVVDRALLKFVARGVAWWRAVLDGKSIAGVARANGVSQRLIGIHLPAAFLAPDILELIVDGRQPPSLTASALRRARIPIAWAEQRRLFGLT